MELSLRQIDNVNWENTEISSEQSQTILSSISGRPGLLKDIVEAALENAELRQKCEKYDLLTKLVLYESPAGARLRLHVFHQGYFDRPHNHRWPYSSNIIHGRYIHRLFRATKPALDAKIADLEHVMIETRGPKAPYSLNNNIFHSITALEPTVTLIIRGPATLAEFRVMDRVTGDVWNQKGAADESDEEKRQKHLTPEDLDSTLKFLADIGVL